MSTSNLEIETGLNPSTGDDELIKPGQITPVSDNDSTSASDSDGLSESGLSASDSDSDGLSESGLGLDSDGLSESGLSASDSGILAPAPSPADSDDEEEEAAMGKTLSMLVEAAAACGYNTIITEDGDEDPLTNIEVAEDDEVEEKGGMEIIDMDHGSCWTKYKPVETYFMSLHDKDAAAFEMDPRELAPWPVKPLPDTSQIRASVTPIINPRIEPLPENQLQRNWDTIFATQERQQKRSKWITKRLSAPTRPWPAHIPAWIQQYKPEAWQRTITRKNPWTGTKVTVYTWPIKRYNSPYMQRILCKKSHGLPLHMAKAVLYEDTTDAQWQSICSLAQPTTLFKSSYKRRLEIIDLLLDPVVDTPLDRSYIRPAPSAELPLEELPWTSPTMAGYNAVYTINDGQPWYLTSAESEIGALRMDFSQANTIFLYSKDMEYRGSINTLANGIYADHVKHRDKKRYVAIPMKGIANVVFYTTDTKVSMEFLLTRDWPGCKHWQLYDAFRLSAVPEDIQLFRERDFNAIEVYKGDIVTSMNPEIVKVHVGSMSHYKLLLTPEGTVVPYGGILVSLYDSCVGHLNIISHHKKTNGKLPIHIEENAHGLYMSPIVPVLNNPHQNEPPMFESIKYLMISEARGNGIFYAMIKLARGSFKHLAKNMDNGLLYLVLRPWSDTIVYDDYGNELILTGYKTQHRAFLTIHDPDPKNLVEIEIEIDTCGCVGSKPYTMNLPDEDDDKDDSGEDGTGGGEDDGEERKDGGGEDGTGDEGDDDEERKDGDDDGGEDGTGGGDGDEDEDGTGDDEEDEDEDGTGDDEEDEDEDGTGDDEEDEDDSDSDEEDEDDSNSDDENPTGAGAGGSGDLPTFDPTTWRTWFKIVGVAKTSQLTGSPVPEDICAVAVVHTPPDAVMIRKKGTQKYRTLFVHTSAIIDIKGNTYQAGTNCVAGADTQYEVGKITHADKLNADISRSCANGIHMFERVGTALTYKSIPCDALPSNLAEIESAAAAIAAPGRKGSPVHAMPVAGVDTRSTDELVAAGEVELRAPAVTRDIEDDM